MKYCTKCGFQCEDTANNCPQCGNSFVSTSNAPDSSDHTAEFDAKDISDNKVVAMLPYLLGTMGLIISILLANTSRYVQFHVRTALKFEVVSVLLVFVALVLCWTIIVPIAAIIFALIIGVLKIIAFVQVCQGKAKDPAIIGKFGFLK